MRRQGFVFVAGRHPVTLFSGNVLGAEELLPRRLQCSELPLRQLTDRLSGMGGSL